jgi:hypothetical protein
MNVDAEPSIIGEVPTWIVRVIIDYDRVGVPDPIGRVRDIDWGYTPVPVVEPKPVGAATGQAPLVAGAEAAAETAVLPWVIQVKTRIMPFMAYPTVRIGVYMGRIRMSGLVAKIAAFRGRRLTTLILRRLTTLIWSLLRALILRTALIRLWFGTARCGRPTFIGGRAVCRDITMTHAASARRVALWGVFPGMFFAMLSKQHLGLKKKRNRESQ